MQAQRAAEQRELEAQQIAMEKAFHANAKAAAQSIQKQVVAVISGYEASSKTMQDQIARNKALQAIINSLQTVARRQAGVNTLVGAIQKQMGLNSINPFMGIALLLVLPAFLGWYLIHRVRRNRAAAAAQKEIEAVAAEIGQKPAPANKVDGRGWELTSTASSKSRPAGWQLPR